MSSKIFDTVIVGAGVSGLSCAIELKIEYSDKKITPFGDPLK